MPFMAAVDPEQHQVVYRVAVIGGVGQRFVERLSLSNGELELPEVLGYRPRLAFSLFPDDPWSGDGSEGSALEALVPALDALVLTDDFSSGAHYSSAAVERLSKVLAPIKLRIPAAVYGGPALAEEWSSLSGASVVQVTDPGSDDSMSIIKALVKPLLRSNFRSTPPPPPAS
jgi:hypothetical protein